MHIFGAKDTLQLTADAVVVDRRGDHQHFRFLQQRIDFLHIILLNALSAPFGMAVFAGETAADLHPAHVHHIHLMARRHSPFPERLNHTLRVSVGPGTAV